MTEPTLHVTLTDLRDGQVQLRFWRDNPNDFRQRTLSLADLGAMVHTVEPGQGGTPGSPRGKVVKQLVAPAAGGTAVSADVLAEADLAPLGRRLFRWLDGDERVLARELQSFAGVPAVALAVDCAGQLAALPWELLHDGTGFLVEATNPGVLPVRWRKGAPSAAAENRALTALFMATSPRAVAPALDFEAEEQAIRAATRHFPLALVVEDSGDLDELAVQVRAFGPGALDVVHLTGHAENTADGPRFLTETATGERRDASAREIAEAVPHRPRLLFLSGCRTGQAAEAGSVQSLAEDLLTRGFPAVLGWGRPVSDREATRAAAGLYGRLSSGEGLVPALLATFREQRQAQARHWHLLRLFLSGEVPGALVTPLRWPGRRPAPLPAAAHRFLAGAGKSKAAGPATFSGRRRSLQGLLKRLREDEYPAGVVIHGPAGVGKTLVAARLCERLVAMRFEAAAHAGVLDEPALLACLAPQVRAAARRAALEDRGQPLKFRLQNYLEQRQSAGERPLVLVLDAFERNITTRKGHARITPGAGEVLEALVYAMTQAGGARCIIASRTPLPATLAASFYQEELTPGAR